MKFRKFYLTKDERTFRCEVYTSTWGYLCVDIYEKVKIFNYIPIWKNRAEYTVVAEDYNTAYAVANSALDNYLLSEEEERKEKLREKLFWGLDK